MNYYVLLKMVPDTVEELEIASDEKTLNAEFLRYKPSDPDEHALEAALLLKEKHGGTVTVVALEAPEVNEVLFTALAKGADKAVLLSADIAIGSGAAAEMFVQYLLREGKASAADTLILLRSQAIDDLEGEIGPFLATALKIPYLAVITSITIQGGEISVIKEFSGGLRGEFSMKLPAVLGIQSADKPPRYVPIAKVRNAMKTAKIETLTLDVSRNLARYPVSRMYKPQAAGHAQMFEGGADAMADQIVKVLAGKSLI